LSIVAALTKVTRMASTERRANMAVSADWHEELLLSSGESEDNQSLEHNRFYMHSNLKDVPARLEKEDIHRNQTRGGDYGVEKPERD
jgi:hypothetical protein